jgi:molecular chaperone DnaK (HSP70)
MGETAEVVVPSMVASRSDGLIVGDAAVREGIGHPESIVWGLKRVLGRAPGDDIAEEVARRMGATLSLTGSQLSVRTIGGQVVFVEDATAALLRHVADRVDPEPNDPRQAVIAIPEWYEAPQESSLGVAARKAGLEVLRYIEDSAAMALSLAFDEPGQRTVAFVNLGAGALSVAFTTIEPRSVFLLSSLSERRVGGDDVEELLLDLVLGTRSLEGALERVPCRRALGEMIEEYAETGRSARSVEIGPGDQHMLSLDDTMVEEALGKLREPLVGLYEAALDEAALDSDEVDIVYACGSLCIFPEVADMLHELTEQVPRCDPALDVLPARGAALQAAILGGGMEGPLVFDGKSTGSLHVSDFDQGSS